MGRAKEFSSIEFFSNCSLKGMHDGVGTVPHLTGGKPRLAGGKSRLRGNMTEVLMLVSAQETTPTLSHEVEVEGEKGETTSFNKFWKMPGQ